MWELIRSNKRKSFYLFVGMGIILLFLGYFFGLSLIGEEGGIYGVFAAIIIWIVLSLVSYFSGSSILLSISNAKQVRPDVHPQLFNVVEEMKIASNLPKIPKIYIINEEAPNAFATGRNPENSAIAVTAGLLAQMNRDELQGVVAHEMSHILNRDILFMTFSGVMMGSIIMLSNIYLRGMWFSAGSSLGRYSNRSYKSSGGLITIITLLLAIFGPIAAQSLYFAISRKREYLADASSARLTRYPEGLASALEKLSENRYTLHGANKATAGLFIVNPLKKKGMKLSNLSSTHPPILERVRILRNMSSGANYSDYQKAYSSVKQKGENVIPLSALANKEQIGIRDSSKTESISPTNQKRTLGDLVMKVNKYSFLLCDCGLKLKAPPEFKGKEVTCPRCGKRLTFSFE